MDNVIGVMFKPNSKVSFFNVADFVVNEGEYIVVETDRGLQCGLVVATNIKKVEDLLEAKQVLRKATMQDIKKYEKNLEDSLVALAKARKIAEQLKLNMNILDASYTLDRHQLLFNFLSDTRIDFRNMAKELASIYKTRIELRQVGVRDRAKEISGIGQCGRELCCSCFLKDFGESVTINMAKNQNLALNPNKINGQCGRLLCCLNYEDDIYTLNRKEMPSIGDEVETEKGNGKVISLDILNKSYIVNVPDEGKVEINLKSKCDECRVK